MGEASGAAASFGSESADQPRQRATVIETPSGAPRPVAWLHDVGRSPGSRVEASFGLPGRAQWHDRTSLAADSCGGSSGIARLRALTGFPFDPSREPTNRRKHAGCCAARQNVASHWKSDLACYDPERVRRGRRLQAQRSKSLQYNITYKSSGSAGAGRGGRASCPARWPRGPETAPVPERRRKPLRAVRHRRRSVPPAASRRPRASAPGI